MISFLEYLNEGIFSSAATDAAETTASTGRAEAIARKLGQESTKLVHLGVEAVAISSIRKRNRQLRERLKQEKKDSAQAEALRREIKANMERIRELQEPEV